MHNTNNSIPSKCHTIQPHSTITPTAPPRVNCVMTNEFLQLPLQLNNQSNNNNYNFTTNTKKNQILFKITWSTIVGLKMPVGTAVKAVKTK